MTRWLIKNECHQQASHERNILIVEQRLFKEFNLECFFLETIFCIPLLSTVSQHITIALIKPQMKKALKRGNKHLKVAQ